ncbi:hypothetical protein O181_070320 [Austropuccinia psidii MF-1]|uniref:Uncharacterized protein n=1 Tax=Austropuccinia psidii MF-1 TaxID=1389203 RepID=A0A9Q3I8Y1_9BASI|nr:hypothetical protein [Austropuccinia psidii MF-1]
MLISIIGICSEEELDKEEEDLPLTSKDQKFDPDKPDAATSAERRQSMKNRTMAFAKMSCVYSILQEEPETVLELKFDESRKLDIKNENLPPELIEAGYVEGPEEFAEYFSHGEADAGEPSRTRSPSGTMH